MSRMKYFEICLLKFTTPQVSLRVSLLPPAYIFSFQAADVTDFGEITSHLTLNWLYWARARL